MKRKSKENEITFDKGLENPTPIYTTGSHINYITKLDVF